MKGAWVTVACVGLALGACSTNTRGSWSCNAPDGAGTCSSIASMDAGGRQTASRSPAEVSPALQGAHPVRWWDPQPFVFGDGSGPQREGDQVLTVVFAPWVDSVGDFHGRSEVRAVMRRGGWYMPTPSTMQASETLRRVGRNAVSE